MLENLMQILGNEMAVIGYALLRVIVIFLLTLGITYIFKKLLILNVKERIMNIIIIIMTFALSLWSVVLYDTEILVHPQEFWWRTLVYGTLSLILFIVIGKTFYERMDNYLDEKFAPNTDEAEILKLARRLSENKDNKEDKDA